MPRAKPSQAIAEPARTGLLEGSLEQQAIWDAVLNTQSHVVVEAVAGSGKCLGKGTPILMFDGSIRPVEDVCTGDLLMGPDSKPRRVLKQSRGVGRLYKITPVKGDSWKCNDRHVMTLAGTNRFNGQIRDVPLAHMLSGSRAGVSSKGWKLFRVPVDFPEAPVPLDPYIAGLWLGDGTTRGPCWTMSTRLKKEPIRYLDLSAKKLGVECVIRDDGPRGLKSIRYRSYRRGETPVINPVWCIIRSFLRTPDGVKRIPKEYLVNSRGNRLKLLAGLLDTDGHYSRGYYEITTKHQTLSEEILYLCRSLGFAAYCSVKWVKLPSMHEAKPYYRITISGELLNQIPCLVPRKQAAPRRQIKRTNVTGWGVKRCETGYYYGFELDGDGRFLLGDFTVTHNSTTAVQACLRASRDWRIIFLAFNKHIAVEGAGRLADAGCFNVDVMTYHAFGLRACKAADPSLTIADADPSKRLAYDLLTGGRVKPRYGRAAQYDWINELRFKRISSLTAALCSHAKANLAYSPEELITLADVHNLAPGPELDRAIELVPQVLEKSLQSHEIGFDDMIWRPVKLGLAFPSAYDLYITDEFQDLCLAQQEMLMLAMKDSRAMVLGDSRQSLYKFRGADARAMERMVERLRNSPRGVLVLPLNETRRCPHSVVAEARKIVPEIRALQNAAEGVVASVEPADFAPVPGDMVLCRINKELVSAAYALLRKGVKAVIRGRDIGKGLNDLVDKLKAPFIPDLLARLNDWEDKQREKLLRMGDRGENRLAALEDQCGCLRVVAEDAESVESLKSRISTMFSDFTPDGQPNHAVVLSSIHRGKGLEADRVWVLRPDLLPIKRKKQSEEDMRQEVNCLYVAVTRARRELRFVGGMPDMLKRTL